jgi:alkylresorcinol/alkylpyrone synthase
MTAVLPAPPAGRALTVVSDFRPFHEDRVIPQARLNAYLSWLIASARCVERGAADEAAARAIFDETTALVERFGVKSEHVGGRVMLAFPAELVSGETLNSAAPYPETLSAGQLVYGDSLDQRMRAYGRRVRSFLDEEAYPAREADAAPDDIVHVTCAGYLAPNPIERMIAERRWSTVVTNSYHMGCYGAFPGVRIANGVLSAGGTTLAGIKRRVDVVHTELVSLHTEVFDHSAGNIITMTLFGDGFIRYSLTPESRDGFTPAGLRLRAAEEFIIPDSADEMTWDLGPHAFHMYLSARVPLFIRDHVPAVIDRLARQVGVTRRQLLDTATFAVHPGGPRIVQLVAEQLGLSDAQVQHSRAVLHRRGNMSSATVPYIWKAICEDDGVAVGTPIVSLAFGPGLTAAGLLMEKVGGTSSGTR